MDEEGVQIKEDRIVQIIPLPSGLRTNAIFDFKDKGGIIESLVIAIALINTNMGQRIGGIAFHNDGFLICEQTIEFISYYDATDLEEKAKIFKDKLGIDINGRTADTTEN